MVVCLVVHPLLVEVNEVICRLSVMGNLNISSSRDMRKVKSRLLSEYRTAFFAKAFFAFSRRFMLLNIGDASLTIIAIVFTSIEEALSRAFIVEIDTAMRKLTGKPQPFGTMLDVQRFMWSADVAMSSIVEYVAIIGSSFAYILMEPHALAINLGYQFGEKVAGGVIFVQLMLELLLECLVDIAALWAEAEHGISIDAYFFHVDSILEVPYHLFTCLVGLVACLLAFGRYPTAFTCSSNFICDCIDQPAYAEWYNATCTLLTSNITSNATNDDFTNATLAKVPRWQRHV